MCKFYSIVKGFYIILLKFYMIIKFKIVKDIYERIVKLNFLNNVKWVNIMNIFNIN